MLERLHQIVASSVVIAAPTIFAKEVFAVSKQRISFSKNGTARFISHLDLMRTLQRTFLRAGISIWHTEGYHPHPYISIPLPLPLGFSSECEVLEFGLLDGATLETLPELMNQVLPSGITVHRCYDGGLPFRRLHFVRYQITMEFDTPIAQEAMGSMQEMLGRDTLVITKRSKKAKSGFKELDIIPLVRAVDDLTAQEQQLDLTILLLAQNPGLNPDLIMETFRKEYPDLAPNFVSIHRKEILDDQLQPYE
jgi:radical SAM-linked protein